MFYYLYEIKNLVNNKIYVGVHQTKDMNDGYMGSGKVIQDAIKKYGKENFSKVILEMFDNPDDMFLQEKEIVNEEFLSRKDVYNLRRGGTGGFDYINSHGLNINRYERTDEWKANLAERMTENNPSRREDVKIKNGARVKKLIGEGKHPFGDSDKQRELCMRQLKNGTHAFLGERGSNLQKKRIADGTHNFNKINSELIECEYCSFKTTIGNHRRWHGDKCKKKGSDND